MWKHYVKKFQKHQCILKVCTLHGQKEREDPLPYIHNVKFQLLSTYLDACRKTQAKKQIVFTRVLKILLEDYNLKFVEFIVSNNRNIWVPIVQKNLFILLCNSFLTVIAMFFILFITDYVLLESEVDISMNQLNREICI